MRTFEGFGGNVLFLDSKKVIARTPYIEEECKMSLIRNASYDAPNFQKNGCLTIVTDNNIIPLYFVQKHSAAMVEAFSIINALVKKNDECTGVITGKNGIRIGTAKCVEVGHPILRNPGRMNIFLFPNSFRCEYIFVDQGCSIPFKDVSRIFFHLSDEQICLLTVSEGIVLLPEIDLSSFEEQGRLKNTVSSLSIAFFWKKELRTLTFKGKGCKQIGKGILEAYILWMNNDQEVKKNSFE